MVAIVKLDILVMALLFVGYKLAPNLPKGINKDQESQNYYSFYFIMNLLRNIRSITLFPVKNRKVSFCHKLGRYCAYLEANGNLNALKSHSRSYKVIRGHLRSNNEIWKID